MTKVSPIILVSDSLTLSTALDGTNSLVIAVIHESDEECIALSSSPNGSWNNLTSFAKSILLANPTVPEFDTDVPVLEALFKARADLLPGRDDLRFTSKWLPNSEDGSSRTPAQKSRYMKHLRELRNQYLSSGINLALEAAQGKTILFPGTNICLKQERDKYVLGRDGRFGSSVALSARDAVLVACAIIADAKTKEVDQEAWAPFTTVAFQTAPPPKAEVSVAEKQVVPLGHNMVQADPTRPVEVLGIPYAYVIEP